MTNESLRQQLEEHRHQYEQLNEQLPMTTATDDVDYMGDTDDEYDRREYIEEELISAENALECILCFANDEDIRRSVVGAYRSVIITREQHYGTDVSTDGGSTDMIHETTMDDILDHHFGDV